VSDKQMNAGKAGSGESHHEWAWTNQVPMGRSGWRGFGKWFWRVPVEIKRERKAVCSDCEEYVPATTQCRQCSCAMGIKGWLAAASCPLGKWGPATPPVEAGDARGPAPRS